MTGGVTATVSGDACGNLLRIVTGGGVTGGGGGPESTRWCERHGESATVR